VRYIIVGQLERAYYPGPGMDKFAEYNGYLWREVFGSTYTSGDATLGPANYGVEGWTTFEVGMYQLGGFAVYLAPGDIGLGKRESVADVARNLSRWVDGIMARTFAHRTVVELAQYATVPVINALTDREHPCQALACGLTMLEHWGDTKGRKLVFVGDGNNVAHSLMLLCPLLGMDFTIACPEGYEPKGGVLQKAELLARKYGTSVEITHDPHRAVRDADIIYTDVWASMGQEAEREKRLKVFRPYQVNAQLLSEAKPECLISHCLPAHRGEEITDEVLDGPQSVALDEAENRLHVQKALLIELMEGNP
ncbi:MAG TPA: ornithine carbamoyltransferase, partial [Candidatus Latescibacteria bacterium]|nr:ornithine carbamoyltransferase [Candidatus Latescibacterota bacterium]